MSNPGTPTQRPSAVQLMGCATAASPTGLGKTARSASSKDLAHAFDFSREVVERPASTTPWGLRESSTQLSALWVRMTACCPGTPRP